VGNEKDMIHVRVYPICTLGRLRGSLELFVFYARVGVFHQPHNLKKYSLPIKE